MNLSGASRAFAMGHLRQVLDLTPPAFPRIKTLRSVAHNNYRFLRHTNFIARTFCDAATVLLSREFLNNGITSIIVQVFPPSSDVTVTKQWARCTSKCPISQTPGFTENVE